MEDNQQAGSGLEPTRSLCDPDFLEQSRRELYQASAAGECLAFVCIQLESPLDSQHSPVPVPCSEVSQVQHALASQLDCNDRLAVVGSEALLLSFRRRSEEAMLRLIVKLQNAMTEQSWHENSASRLHIHTGVSTFPADGLSPDALLARACTASEVARQSAEGNSSVRFFRPDMLMH